MLAQDSGTRVAVITGASRGIGKQLCIDLAKAGWDVVVAARSTRKAGAALPGTIDETAESVEKCGQRAMVVPLDVRNEGSCLALADRVFDEWGRCDLLVNNAAIAPPTPSLQDSIKRWRLAVDVNLNGPFYLTHSFAPRMSGRAGAAHIINISSIAAVLPEFCRASYTATKAGLEAMTQVHAHELRGQVAVNALRLDLSVWSEGYEQTLPQGHEVEFEHPVIMSDAVFWVMKQPVEFTGKVLVISQMREQGAIRPRTLVGEYPQ